MSTTATQPTPVATLDTTAVDAYLRGDAELAALAGFDATTLALLRGRAQFFVDGGHWERALIMLDMLAALDRTDRDVPLLRVEALLALGRSDDAMAQVEALLARNPDDHAAWVAKAEVLIRGGEMVPAATLLAQVLDGDPDATTAAGARARAVAARAHALYGAS